MRIAWRRAGAIVGLGLATVISVRGESNETKNEPLRVGTSGDYAPFSWSEQESWGADHNQQPTGFSVAVIERYAADRAREVEFVPFRWPMLLGNLAANRFDLAISGITVRPERSSAGVFSLPLMETGAVVILPQDAWGGIDGLDQPIVRIGVNAGGHLEQVTEERFPRATRISIPNNRAVLDALRNGSVQAIVTDNVEASGWLKELGGGYIMEGPFTRDRKAALIRSDLGELAADFDAWLLQAERSGELSKLRETHFGPGPWKQTAEPLAALLAAVDERLALMPTLAYVKRETGVPLEVPEREASVLDAAATAVLDAAGAKDADAPDFLLVRAFFRAQMEAAKGVQRATVKTDFAVPAPLPDLDTTLRPALLRIGNRAARLLLELDNTRSNVSIAEHARADIRAPFVKRSEIRAIAKTIRPLMSASTADGASVSAPAAP